MAHAGAVPDALSPASRRRSTAAVGLLYGVPLLLTAGLLAAVGLPVLALALLVIEALMITAVALARRRPVRPVGPAARTRSGSSVVLVLGAAIVGTVLGIGLLLRATT